MSAIVPPNESLGRVLLLAVANPAAGAVANVVVPSGRLRRLRTVSFLLVAGAAVATRTPFLDFLDGGATAYFRAPQTTPIVAGGAALFVWSFGGVVTVAGALPFQAGLSDVVMQAGHTLNINVQNLQAADQISNIRLSYEEWLTL